MVLKNKTNAEDVNALTATLLKNLDIHRYEFRTLLFTVYKEGCSVYASGNVCL